MPGKAAVFLCQTPFSQCCGSSATKTNHGLTGYHLKGHATPQQAFNCFKNYLLKQGYTAIGPRELSPPDGGPVLVLTKKCRYGGRLRRGKEGTRHQPSNTTHAGLVIG